MNDSRCFRDPPVSVRLWAHDSSLNRRLAWRFESLGHSVESRKFGPLPSEPPAPPAMAGRIEVIDLGWSASDIETAMRAVFELTDPDRADQETSPVIVLAPRYDSATRPQWAELGVRLILDRTTPPPDIVATVLKILRNRQTRPDRQSFAP